MGEDGGREGKRKGSCSFYEVLSITWGFLKKLSWLVTHPPAEKPGFHSLLCLKRCQRFEIENIDVFIKWHMVALEK